MPRNFAGLNIPIAVQSVYLRDYCYRINYNYLLPKVEWCMPGVYIELYKLITSKKNIDIAMTSIRMLPTEVKMLNLLLEERSVRFHFVLEKLVVESESLKELLESQQKYNELSHNFLF